MIKIEDFRTLAPCVHTIASNSRKGKSLIVSFSPFDQSFRFYIKVNNKIEITNFLSLDNAIKRYNEI